MDELCATEVVQLHRFIRDWLAGALPQTDDRFARFSEVMANGFVIVSPRGVTTARGQLCDELFAAHGSRGNDFEIRIDNLTIRRDMGAACVVTYEEWQRDIGRESARIATALLGPCAGAPNSVEWLHLHETWLRGFAPMG